MNVLERLSSMKNSQAYIMTHNRVDKFTASKSKDSKTQLIIQLCRKQIVSTIELLISHYSIYSMIHSSAKSPLLTIIK